MHHSQSIAIDTNAKFEVEYLKKVQLLLNSPAVNRGPAHATTDETMAMTHELMHLTETIQVDLEMSAWQEVVKPNLPWAEDHFRERVSGVPLNPAPSEEWWPFARNGNREHKADNVFSHTYPERFWPKRASATGSHDPLLGIPNWGIRYGYGDLDDLIEVLKANVNTRQAYLPIWFPEDLYAAREGFRVPCSMGYHFIRDVAKDRLDCVYTMRSCDIVRFYRDDLYMAGRLLQWVGQKVDLRIGRLVVHIDNLHCFPGDRPYLEQLLKHRDMDMYPIDTVSDKRAGYNFGALG